MTAVSHEVIAKPIERRFRLAARWAKFSANSLLRGDFDFAYQGVRAEFLLLGLSAMDLVASRKRRECSVCGWIGREFYPNVGPGYDERRTLCPGCASLDRHRSLLGVLDRRLGVFREELRMIEVAPMRGMHPRFVAAPNLDYTSFDLERFAMERGDITAMRYADGEADVFLCFHVLEHIPDEAVAVEEIIRVLKPGGVLVAQVPVDWSVEVSYEYDKPDPREVGHVRRYGCDFASRIAAYGFKAEAVHPADLFEPVEFERHGLSKEPIYLFEKL